MRGEREIWGVIGSGMEVPRVGPLPRGSTVSCLRSSLGNLGLQCLNVSPENIEKTMEKQKPSMKFVEISPPVFEEMHACFCRYAHLLLKTCTGTHHGNVASALKEKQGLSKGWKASNGWGRYALINEKGST